MSTTVRWLVAALAALLIVGLLGWARGYEHHHGDEVGSAAAVGPASGR